ncbi:mechanosensitive channel MscK [Kistimonas asteriae]|uniref:mechanosensitive channel MscK n=1 Tax=Kistimonas asteriae TaxID=517724 RepID=UPI001BA576B9|nr:mechanosensitive channel MscK [Kistimonas asteriae]
MAVKQYSRLLLGLLAGLMTMVVMAAPAETPTNGIMNLAPPSVRIIRDSMERVQKDPNRSEENRTQLTELYQQTLQYLQESEENSATLAALQKRLLQAPAELSSLKQQQKSLKTPTDTELKKDYSRLPMAVLEKQLQESQDQQRTLQQQLSQLNEQITNEQARPDTSQTQIDAIGTQLVLMSDELATLLNKQDQQPFPKTRQQMLLAKQTALQSKSQLLRQEILASSTILDLITHRRDLVRKQLQILNNQIALMQSEVNRKRRLVTEETIAHISKVTGQDNPLLAEQLRLNAGLGQELLQLNDQQSQLQQEDNRIKDLQRRMQDLQQTIEQQTAVLENNPLLGKILREQQQALPKLRLYDDIDTTISDIRLKQFSYGEQRQRLSDPQAIITALFQEHQIPSDQQTGLGRAITDQLQTRRDLLDRVQRELGTLLSIAIDLKLNQKQLQQSSLKLVKSLDDQLFWIPTNPPLDMDWLKTIPADIHDQFTALNTGNILPALFQGVHKRIPQTVIILAIVMVLVIRRKTIQQALSDLSAKVGDVRHDSIWVTPHALFLDALQCAIPPLLIALCGYLISRAGGTYDSLREMGKLLQITGGFWWVMAFATRLHLPGGIAETHFRLPAVFNQKLYQVLNLTRWVMAPLILLVPMREINDVISQLLTMLGCGSLGILLYRLYQQVPSLFGFRLLDSLIWLFLIATPLGLIILILTGYYYTTLVILGHLVISLFVIGVWALLRAVIKRGIYVASRRLAFSRALSRREAMREDREVEIPNLDLETINRQTIRLLNAFMIALLVLLLYWVWQDMITIFSSIDAITITTTGMKSDTWQLGDIMTALLLILVTMVLSRNLPGLLEIAVLSRLQLSQGSGYAISTLLSYSITAIGVLSVLSTLGVSWDKLQWLVAAVGVGLGFGLQEIFANFISGIIILFERPIRIGDTVTIGSLSGTVSRIRIRATTITDWDNKEIVIPNKVFITDQLINWTLSDPETRVVIMVGVAYGSDLAKTRELLLQAADEDPRVLKEPTPSVFFLSFGDSTLNHELRVHVKEMGDRLITLNDLNTRIDTLFREHNIEIAFPQRDIHIRTTEPPPSHEEKTAKSQRRPQTTTHSSDDDPGLDIGFSDDAEPI